MTPEAYRQIQRLQSAHWWFTARRKILHSQLARIHLPVNARILEVGCGPGGNLSMLQEFGQVTAVEMNAGAREYAARLSGVQVLPGRLPDAMPEMESFDLIGLFDVLEHIPDDLAALNSLKPMLRQGGQLLLTVPACPWMFGPHDKAHHHQRRYSAAQLTNLAKKSGWEVKYITHFNTWLYPIIGLSRLLAMAIHRESVHSDMDKQPPVLINKLLHMVFASESAVLRHVRFPVGVSLLCVLRPSS